MKKIKLWIRLLLVVTALALLLAACNNETTPTASSFSPTAQSESTNLSLGAAAVDYDTKTAVKVKNINDGDISTAWDMGTMEFVELNFGKKVKFNTIKLTYSGTTEAWSVRYADGGKWYAIPGASRRLQDSAGSPRTVELAFDVMTTDKISLNFDTYSKPIKVYELEVYYIDGQKPVDSVNAYITELHTELLAKIGAGATAFDIFPDSSYTDIKNMGTVTYTDDRTKVKFEVGKWAKGLDEAKVFNKELKYTSPDGSNDITLRIGNGGQIYSFMTPAGELIPPQNKSAEWMDEVWQVVTVAHKNMLSRDEKPSIFYIHQAGMYKGEDKEALNIMTDTFYSPRLAEHWDEETKTLSTMNLGVMSVAPSMWRSKVPIITQTRFVGDGIIEMTYGVMNYGEYALDFLNFPWGGSRKTTFPHIVMSNKDGSYDQWTATMYDDIRDKKLKNTGGWIAFTEDANDPNSYAVAWVFGKDDYNDGTITSNKVIQPSTIGAFDAIRDQYNCAVVNDSLYVKQNEMFYSRMYIVTGTLSEVAEKANNMAQYVQRGYITTTEEQALLRGIYQDTDKQTGKPVWLPEGEGEPLFYVYDRHVTGSRPLYLLYDNVEHEFVVTVDPYICTNKLPLSQFLDVTKALYKKYADLEVAVPYDGTTDYIGILGYVPLEQSGDKYVKLSDIGGLFRGTGDEDAKVCGIKK